MVFLFCVLIMLLCNDAYSSNYTIAVIFEKNADPDFDMQKIGPAIDMGIEKLNTILPYGLSANMLEMYVSPGGDECTATGFGTLMGSLFYDQHIDGVIGPGECFYCQCVVYLLVVAGR